MFETLTVVGRQRALGAAPSTAGLNLASTPGVSFVFLPDLSSVAGLTWRRAEATRTLRAAMQSVDAVIVRLPSEIGLLAAELARQLGKPMAVEVAGCPWDGLWNQGTWRAKLYAPVRMWRMRRELRRAPFALYVTQQFLQRRYPAYGDIAAVSNVEIGPPQPGVLTRRLARIRGWSPPLVLGLIGSIDDEIKGLRTILTALAGLRPRLTGFELRVLGPGDAAPWRDLAVRHGLAEAVRFCGVVRSGQPVLDWLDEIDIYLQPSFKEGLPRATIEAMSRACPALGSTAGGIPELLPAECLHRPGDARRLGQLILRAAGDRDWQMRQAQRNFQTAGQYASCVLDARRRAFWTRFGACVAGAAGGAGLEHANAQARVAHASRRR